MSEFAYGFIAGMFFGGFVALLVLSWTRAASDADGRAGLIDEWDGRENYTPKTMQEPPTTPPPKPRK